VEKYCKAAQATDDNMVHAHCVLDKEGCKLTLRICNIYCFSTVTMVSRTRLRVTLYVYCLSCCISSFVKRDMFSTTTSTNSTAVHNATKAAFRNNVHATGIGPEHFLFT